MATQSMKTRPFHLFAFDRHGEGGDVTFRHIIAPAFDYFQYFMNTMAASLAC
jgi:hypothetical protein